MRELELAVHPSIDPTRSRSWRASFPFPRAAFVVSIAVHVLAVYALLQHRFIDAPAPPPADFFLFELPAPRPAPVPQPSAEPAPEPAVAPLEPAPPVEERQTEPLPRAIEVVPEPTTIVVDELAPRGEPAPVAVPEPAPEPTPVVVPEPLIDFEAERRRAANEVIGSRSGSSAYLSFSIDDVAPLRPEPEPKPGPSIFDYGGGPDFGGRSVGTVGQQRTKVGRKLAELCNALTGGFGVAFQGFGLFSACASPDGGPSGLFPEVRPAYLDLMPKCVDTRDTAPALALEAPFSTVKCRLVKQEDPEEQP